MRVLQELADQFAILIVHHHLIVHQVDATGGAAHIGCVAFGATCIKGRFATRRNSGIGRWTRRVRCASASTARGRRAGSARCTSRGGGCTSSASSASGSSSTGGWRLRCVGSGRLRHQTRNRQETKSEQSRKGHWMLTLHFLCLVISDFHGDIFSQSGILARRDLHRSA
jgi:hypothetical protein